MSQSLNNTILQVCRECGNFFEISSETNHFVLSGGRINSGAKSGLYRVGQYILLTGSFFVDGIYKISGIDGDWYILDGEPADDEWDGMIFGLRIPPDFILLCGDIQAFINNTDYSSAVTGERNKEYSYTLATDKDGTPIGWQQMFKDRLSFYRNKMFRTINI